MEGPPDSAGETSHDAAGIPDEDTLLAEVSAIELTPAEHQRIKDIVHGPLLNRLASHDRRYLIVGAGDDSAAATRRAIVYEALDGRTDPPATAIRLEDFDLTPDEIRLWTRLFDILCGVATHVVAVVEDFDGGYVWELGLLFAPAYREKTWVLKRRYPDPRTERERYDNGMAASHVRALLTGDRAHEWTAPSQLREAVAKIPSSTHD